MSTNTGVQGKKCVLEVTKWTMVLVLLIMAIVGNYFYRDLSLPLRALAIIVIVSIAGSVAITTTRGKSAIKFAREAYAEVSKVIWPTYQETLRTTLIVAVVTTVTSLILWGLDNILVLMISFITSLRF